MSSRTMGWALEAGRTHGLDRAERSILIAIAYHANRWGRSWPALEMLADDTAWSPRTVSRVLGRLEDAEVLETERRPGWSTLWIFPPEARPKLSTTLDTQSMTLATQSKRVDRVATESVVEHVVESVGGLRQKRIFLPGSGWVEDFGGTS